MRQRDRGGACAVRAISLTSWSRSVTSVVVSASAYEASGADRLISVSQNTRQARMHEMEIKLVRRLAVRNCDSSALQPDLLLPSQLRWWVVLCK